MTEVNIDPISPISMSSDGKTLTLVWTDSKSKTIQVQQGTYTSKE